MIKKFLSLSFFALFLASPVAADTIQEARLSVTNLIGLGVGQTCSGAAVSVSNTANSTSSANTTEYTYSSLSLGDADPNRKIYVAFGASGPGRPTAVTVDGTAGSELAYTGSSENVAAVWVASVTSGTTGDVVITFDDTMSRSGVSVYRVLNSTGVAFDSAIDTGASPLSASLTTPADGGAVGAVFDNDSSVTGITWGNITEEYEATPEAGAKFSSASQTETTETTESISATFTGAASSRKAMALASFGPC